jgi:hypothetical protein
MSQVDGHRRGLYEAFSVCISIAMEFGGLMKHGGVIVLVDRRQFTSSGDTYEKRTANTRVFVYRCSAE